MTQHLPAPVTETAAPGERRANSVNAAEQHVAQGHHELTAREARKVAMGALIGNAMEWYDFFLFTVASAIVFNVQYFDTKDPVGATLASFATFGIGLIVRPIGGIIFGAMGDRIGRRKTLMITVIGIGLVTGLIGLLPPAAVFGFWAPMLLVLLRVAQGLFVGGEWSGAMTIVVEHAPVHQRARYAALPQIGSPIGTILSSGGFFVVGVLMSADTFDAWGWRIPFLLSFPLLFLAVWLRSRLQESPVFQELLETGEVELTPVRSVFKRYWKHTIVGAMAALLGVGGFYLVAGFVTWYGTKILGYDKNLLILGTIVAAAFEIPTLVIGGRVAEKLGATKVIVWGAVISTVLSWPCFLLIESMNPVLLIIGMAVAVSALSIPYAASGTALTGLFPAKLRYTGAGMAQNLAGVLSGFFPLIATALVAGAGDHWWPAATMLFLVSAATAIAGLFIPRLSVPLPGFKH